MSVYEKNKHKSPRPIQIMYCSQIEWRSYMSKENVVLCASSAYEHKYYINEEFEGLPESIKDELKIMCVLYTEDVGGILTLEFEEDGTLIFQVNCDEGDLLFDEIGSVLKIKELQRTKVELLESLELYYKVFFLKEDPSKLLSGEDIQ